MDGAEAFGAKTFEAFRDFINAAIRDDEHRELLARALITGQDAAMRDKRRALGRTLASAASDIGTKVDDELLFIRVLADLDEPHIRLLRLMQTVPERQADRRWEDATWEVHSIADADSGLSDTPVELLRVLQRHGLVWQAAGSDRPGKERRSNTSSLPLEACSSPDWRHLRTKAIAIRVHLEVSSPLQREIKGEWHDGSNLRPRGYPNRCLGNSGRRASP